MAKSSGIIKEVMTGIFLLVMIALLLFFTVIISGVDVLFGRKNRTCTIRFEDVGALKEQDPVYVRGLKVGSVQKLKLADGAVLVKISLAPEVTLREDYAIAVGKTSLLGGACLQISEGASKQVLAETTELVGQPAEDMMADLGQLVKELRAAVNPEELRATVTNIQKASADIADLTARVRKGEGTLGKLFSEDSTAYDDFLVSVDNLKAITTDIRTGKGLLGKLISEEDSTYNDLRSAIANLNAVAADVAAGKGLLGKLMQEDDASYNDLKASLANIRQVTEKLNDPATGFGRLLSQDSTLVADLEASAANIRAVTEKLESGDGTLGKLVNDDGVATELEATIKDVRQIIDNMRDTAPITTFSSLFFGGL